MFHVKHMARTIFDLFADLGIAARPNLADTLVPGRTQFKTLCPQCSMLRRKKRRKNVLAITASQARLAWHCHHCGWEGVRYADEDVDRRRGYARRHDVLADQNK